MRLHTQFAIFLLILIGFSQNNFSQPYKNAKYGPDSLSRIKCAQQLSTLSEFMKIDLYAYAIDAFQHVFAECPAASKNIYLYGARIYKNLIENEKDETAKKRKLDSLMLIYDRRIQYFNEEGYVDGRKGLDLIKYSDRYQEAYELFKKSISLVKENSEDAVLVGLMQTSGWLYKENTLDQQAYLADYSLLLEILESRAQSAKDPDKNSKLADAINTLFLSGNTVDCSALVQILTKQFDSHQLDSNWLQKTISMMDGSKCQDQDFYATCAEKLFTVAPSAESAVQLANLFIRKNDNIKGESYYLKAIGLESDNVRKAKDYYMIALIKSKDENQFKEARSNAIEATKLNPAWGDPYILIGNLYITSAKNCGKNEFEQKAVYWAAVDQFLKAKAVDPNILEESNRLITQYSSYFPNKENAFFYGYTEGNSYAVGCWINETTKVRF